MVEFCFLGCLIPGAVLGLLLYLQQQSAPGKRSRETRILLAAGWIVLITFTLWIVWGLGWTLGSLNSVEEHAAPLVKAIELYVVDHGEAPERLSDLVPKYITELPENGIPGGAFLVKRGFGYHRSEKERTYWSLSVDWEEIGEPSGAGYYYTSKKGHWAQH